MNRLQHFRKYLSVTTVAAVGLAIAGLAHAANPQIQDVEVDGASVEVRATGLGNVVRGGDDLSIEVIATGDIFTMCRNPSGRLVEAQSEFRQNFDFDVDERDITRNGSFTGNFNLEPSAQDVCPSGRWTAITSLVVLDTVEVNLLVNGVAVDSEFCDVAAGECT